MFAKSKLHEKSENLADNWVSYELKILGAKYEILSGVIQ